MSVDIINDYNINHTYRERPLFCPRILTHIIENTNFKNFISLYFYLCVPTYNPIILRYTKCEIIGYGISKNITYLLHMGSVIMFTSQKFYTLILGCNLQIHWIFLDYWNYWYFSGCVNFIKFQISVNISKMKISWYFSKILKISVHISHIFMCFFNCLL